MPTTPATIGKNDTQFAGFESLDSNFIYCPNQFFDVCLPHCSRGAVRLVSYVLLETLRLRDRNGNPVQQDIGVTYRLLIEQAGISRGAIEKAIQEATDMGFISCVVSARKQVRGQTAQSPQFRLRWDDSEQYKTVPQAFRGFFCGEGHRSPIPMTFFSQVVRSEPLAVIKFVGTVLRHTVGYANQFGNRRSQAPLSFSTIQEYANFADRQQAVKAAKRSITNGYVRRVEQGVFGPDETRRKPSTYAPHWLNKEMNAIDSTKKTPEGISTKTTPVKQFKNDPSNSSEKTPPEEFKTHPIRKSEGKKEKQQQASTLSAAALLLRGQGFDSHVAETISEGKSLEQIERQIRWLDARSPKNRLAMLRKSIEQDWAEPAGFSEKALQDEQQVKEAVRRAQNVVVVEADAESSEALRKKKIRQRQWRLQQWSNAATDIKHLAYKRARSRSSVSAYLKRIDESTDANPAPEVLVELEHILQANPNLTPTNSSPVAS